MRSFRSTLARILVANTAVGVMIGVVMTMGSSTVEAAPQSPSVTDPGPSRVELLIARHECWAGEAPSDVIPGHAIVTLPGGRPRVMLSDVGFGIWLDHNPGTVHAFCP